VNVLSLFSGIGGLELGLERAGMTTVGQVEKDPYCLKVLAKHWPEVPRHDDVTTAVEWWQSRSRPVVDVIAGGFPCQDISNAGAKAGIGGERSGLWAYMAHTVRVLRPRYVVMENVSAILVRGLDVVAADLAACGYDVQWDCVPASAIGAHHQRDRWWAVAYPTSDRWRQRWQGRSSGSSQNGEAIGSEALAHADSSGRDGWPRIFRPSRRRQPTNRSSTVLADANQNSRGASGAVSEEGWTAGLHFDASQPTASRSGPTTWAVEPDVGRVAHGVPARVDRLRALGNAVVPQVSEHVGRLLMDFDAQQVAA
jgi:DNA (cytosine-5)-methyltransferase 1